MVNQCDPYSYEMTNESSVCTCGMTYDEEEAYFVAKGVVNGQVQIAINFVGFVSNSIAIYVILQSRELKNSFHTFS